MPAPPSPKADPMKTGLNATRLAIAAFIVPYIFVFSPIMLFIGEYTVFDVVRIVVTSSCGMFCWARASSASCCAS